MAEEAEADVVFSWGCHAYRARQNLLGGSVQDNQTGDVGAKFLLFDQTAKQLYLCRYQKEEAVSPCQTYVLRRLGESERLENPRQLLLCPGHPMFASLEVIAGRARACVWSLEQQRIPETYSLGVTILGAESARAISWVHGTTGCNTLALCLLLSTQVLMVSVEGSGEAGGLVGQEYLRLEVGFPSSCFCWSKDGCQLLVGGSGQILCFAWAANRDKESSKSRSLEKPLSKDFLCGGDCVEIRALHSAAFLCRVDHKQKAPESQTQTVPALMLPGGQTCHAPARPVQTEPLVQELEEREMVQTTAEGLGGGLSANSLNSLKSLSLSQTSQSSGGPVPGLGGLGGLGGLQVVPCHRHLLPLCFERRRDGLKLHCGNEQSIEGELVAVVEGDKLGTACVVVGSFCNAEISVFGLLPPHGWLSTSCRTTRTTSGSEGEWHKLFSVDLSPTAPMRLSGLAVWGGLAELEVHCLLSERSEPGPGANIARELWHKQLDTS
ncbi:unnamed protein product [Symbiodinium sp. CCMP2592]|nr:unnamed protein product [Symbiodinium sp. CCMP2592]